MSVNSSSKKDLSAFSCSDALRSLSKRRELFEAFLNLDSADQPEAACLLLCSSHKDLREAVLDFCSSDVLASKLWQNCIVSHLNDAKFTQNAHWVQCALVLMQRMEGPLSDDMKAFCQRMMDSEDSDVRYQAFCLAELGLMTDSAYLDRVRGWLEDSDEDFRIVAIQALGRLSPEWALEALASRASKAFGVEAFHIVLTQIRLCPIDRRGAFIDRLVSYVGDDRFSFAAIQALSEYGDERAIPVLLKVAKSFLGEPTTKVAAAGAAAKLGSEKGRKILLKFATSGHGNPKYAEQLLDALDGKCQNKAN